MIIPILGPYGPKKVKTKEKQHASCSIEIQLSNCIFSTDRTGPMDTRTAGSRLQSCLKTPPTGH